VSNGCEKVVMKYRSYKTINNNKNKKDEIMKENSMLQDACLYIVKDHLDVVFKEISDNPASNEKEIFENLHVLEAWSLPFAKGSDRLNRDKFIKTVPFKDLNFFTLRKTGKDISPEYEENFVKNCGINIYQLKDNPEIKYAILCIHFRDYEQLISINFFVCLKGQLKNIYRSIKTRSRKVKDIKVPILHDGIMERVLNQTVRFLNKRKQMKDYGSSIRRGIVLTGKPGNGKTMICSYIKDLCRKKGISFSVVNSGDIDRAYSNGVKELDELFHKTKLIIFDDIDISYLNRNDGSGGNSKIACAILSAMDGIQKKHDVVRIFTTNEDIKDLDAAFVRPQRIDDVIKIMPPDKEMKTNLIRNKWPKDILTYIEENDKKELTVYIK
jgi:DNA replication protein DnaC